MEVQMSSRRKVKSQMLIKETFYMTRKFFHKTFRHFKSFVLEGFQKLPKTHLENPNFRNKINIKLQKVDNFYKNFTEQWDSKEAVKKKEGLLSPKEQMKGDEQCSKNSMNVANQSRPEGLKEEKKAMKFSVVKQEESSFLAADALARKMKELEMMDVNDEDHVLDLQEVLHYYSLLTCPAYLEIVDKFFMDMYLEFNLPQPSRSVNSSMRKLGSATASVHCSMRKLGSATASVHSSMRKLGSATASAHNSMRKLGSASVHSSMRSLGPLKL